jgi:hypothetical protein
MNQHFTLFHEAMARPGNTSRHGNGAAAGFAALVIGLVILSAIVYPMISG